jgi:ribonucleoside-diphosphate reductase beta chain
MSVLNLKNDNYKNGKYPLFLGEPLGLNDEINVTYPEIERMKKLHQSMYWLPEEFSFEQDRRDLLEAPDSEKDVMILNLLAQWALDSMASRSIIELFGPLTSNTEAHGWFLTQSFFEDIHAATYSKIIRNSLSDPQAAIEKATKNLEVFKRTEVIGKVFDDMKKVTGRYMAGIEMEEEYVKYTILRALFALYGLEQISFMSSFASTFALVETGRYQGIGKAVSSICNDESVHADGDLVVFRVMKNEDYRTLFNDNIDELTNILDEIVAQEHRWSEYIFDDGRRVLGLNTALLKEYVNYTAKPCYDALGLKWDTQRFGNSVSENPLPYMEKYFDRDLVQSAPQEIESNNYRVGQVENDLGDDDVFDF